MGEYEELYNQAGGTPPIPGPQLFDTCLAAYSRNKAWYAYTKPIMRDDKPTDHHQLLLSHPVRRSKASSA